MYICAFDVLSLLKKKKEEEEEQGDSRRKNRQEETAMDTFVRLIYGYQYSEMIHHIQRV